MSAPVVGARFITGLTDPQLLALETLAGDLMIEVLTQVADFYADRLVERAAAAGAVVAAASDGLPPGRSFVSPDDFQGIAGATDRAINDTIMPLVGEVYASGAGAVRRGLVETTAVHLPPIHSATGAAYLRQHADVFAGIGDDMGAAVRAGLAEGFELGESIPQLADRVRGAAGTTARSATLTARTAVIDAANRGSIDTARASQIPMQKEWMATPDARTRQTHKNADGQRVDIAGKFIVGGFECDYPAEHVLPAQERLRCRCTLGYEIPEFTPADLDDIRDRAERYIYANEPDDVLEPYIPDLDDAIADLENLTLPAARVADEAMRMTVAELKAVGKRNNVPLLGITKKADLVAHLRTMESTMGRKFEGLPLRPPDEFELSRAERRPAPSATATLRGRNIGRQWWEALPAGDTGPGGVRVEQYWITEGQYGYHAKHGTAWRIDGTAYFVEHADSEYGSTKVSRVLQQLIDANADVPLASKSNDGYAYLLRPNPADAFWQRQYNNPKHESDASAGNGGVMFWNRTKWPTISHETLRHETGHNLDSAKGKRPQGWWTSDGSEWEDAAVADAKVSSLVKTDVRGLGVVDRRRDWKWGVTDYGRSSRGEDFADSVMLYQRGKIARGIAVGESVERDLYFRDLFPNRAAILDGIFPDIATAQRATIAELRAGKKVEKSSVLDNAGKRAEARARQADIDRASRYAETLADIDYEVWASGSPLAVLDRAVADAVFTKAEATALRKAIDAGDRVKLGAVFDRIAAKRGIKLNGRSGDLTPFDVDTMQVPAADMPPAGELVRVQRGASVLTRGDEEIQLARAQVRRVTADELARERVKLTEPAANMAKLADDIARDPGPLTGARIGQLADRANVGRATREALVKAASTPDGLKRAIAAELRKVKAKANGVANRAVDFDPETMQAAPGVTIAPGARVKVTRTGYTTELDGEQVVVLRTLVEPIAPTKVVVNRFPLADGLRGALAVKRQRERHEVMIIIRDSGPGGRGLQGDPLEQAQALESAGFLRYDRGKFVLTDKGREYLAPLDVAVAPEPSPDLSYALRQDRLRETLRGADYVETKIEGGISAATTLRTYSNGDRVIIKDTGTAKVAEGSKSDAEELSALVLDTAGVRSAAVVRIDNHTIAMEFIEGKQGGQSGVLTAPAAVKASAEGRLLGLVDALLGHRDRNLGNWIRTPDGRLVAIDNGGAFGFGDRAAAGNPFTSYLMGKYPDSPWKKDFELPEGVDFSALRSRLQALLPEFARFEHGRRWHKQMMDRLDEIEKRAAKVTRRAPDVVETVRVKLPPAATRKSRTEKPAGYPERFPVPDSKADPSVPWKAYDPPEYTAQVVLGNDRSKKPGGWADPPRPESKWPTGPVRTGIKGRGLLGKYGPNQAADPIITRINPRTGKLEMVAIRRGDTDQWAIPGGMVDDGEVITQALAREFLEETGGELDMSSARVVYKGFVDDPRNTDTSWMETTAVHRHLTPEEAARLELSGPADAAEISALGWREVTDEFLDNMYASHSVFVREAIKDLPRGETVEIVEAGDARARLRNLAGRRAPEGHNLGGGSAEVRLRTYANGEQAVSKTYRSPRAGEVRNQVEAEVLGPRVLDAFGIRNAATVRVDASTTLSEYITGHKTGAELGLDWSPDPALEAAIYGSDSGHMLGIADYVMSNTDRNSGNFYVVGDPGGELIGIDHGYSFWAGRDYPMRDFTEFMADADGKLRTSIPELADVDFDAIRTRLLALEPEFVALKREAWFKRMMSRLAAVEKAAKKGRAEKAAAEIGRPDPEIQALPVVDKPLTLTQAAKGTNPKYGTTSGGPTYRDAGKAGKSWDPSMGPEPSGAYEENCTNIVHAFEMRMRGYDVEAAPLDVLNRSGYAAGRTFKEFDELLVTAWRYPDGRPNDRTMASQPWRSFKQIDEIIERDWPEGGRGAITVGKHIFSVTKRNGKAIYVEGQYDASPTRIVTTIYKKKFGSSMSLSGGEPEEAKLFRFDDLVPTREVLQTLVPKAGGSQ